MIGSRVTRRYAKALFELAKEQDLLDDVERDLLMISEMYHQSSELDLLISSPIIPGREKKAVLDKLFKNKVHQVTFDFLMFLIEKGREEYVPEIIDHFNRSLDEFRGIVRGKLFTAHPFNEQQKKNLMDKLNRHTGKNVQIEEEIDASLIGGFVVRLEDTVIDNSLRNQLNKMRQRLIKR